MSLFLPVWVGVTASWPMDFDGFQYLYRVACTCWARRAIESYLLIEIVIPLGWLCIDRRLVAALVLPNDVVISILTRAAIDLSNVWQAHSFHFAIIF